MTAGNATGYQWKRNGANISGATAASYTTPATTVADNGARFSVPISNPGGSVTSRSAKLTVRAAEPVFSPANQFQGTHPATTLQVSLHTSTAGAQMYYTLTTNGTIPTRQNGTLVPGQGTTITVPARDHKFLKAFAFKSGLADSNITTGEYDTMDPQTFPGAPTPSRGNNTTKGAAAEVDADSAAVQGSSNDKAASQSDHEQPAMTGAPNTGVTTLAITTQADYDGNGNMTTGFDGSTYTYDAQNRLLIATSNGTTDTFLYDGLNRQIGKKIGSQPLFYRVYDGWDLLGEYKTGTSGAFWAYLYGNGEIVKNLVTNNYYYQDASGSTSHVADGTGALKEYYRYDLHGQPLFFKASGQQVSDTVIGVRHLFTGQQWYNEIGLYDLRNRYYSPDIGRFLQTDPLGFGGDPANLYRYCGNSPLNFLDYSGENPTKITVDGNNIYIRIAVTFSPGGFNQIQQDAFLGVNQYLNTGQPIGKYNLTWDIGRATLGEQLRDLFGGPPVTTVYPSNARSRYVDNKIYWNPMRGILDAAHEIAHDAGAPHSGNDPSDLMSGADGETRPNPGAQLSVNDVTKILESNGIGVNGNFPSNVPYLDFSHGGNSYNAGDGTTYLYDSNWNWVGRVDHGLGARGDFAGLYDWSTTAGFGGGGDLSFAPGGGGRITQAIERYYTY